MTNNRSEAAMKTFMAAAGSPFSDQDAELIGVELAELARQGEASAEGIVRYAAPSDSPLHPYFEWDDAIAAHEYRKEQARCMARSIEVVVVGASGEERRMRFLHLVRQRADEPGQPREGRYWTLDQVERDEDACAQVLGRARGELLSWRRRYVQYVERFSQFREETAGVFRAIEAMTEVADS